MVPSIGRIVHLHRRGDDIDQPIPMIVTAVHSDGCVSGVAFSAAGFAAGFVGSGPNTAAAFTSVNRSTAPGGDGSAYWWDWPPRV